MVRPRLEVVSHGIYADRLAVHHALLLPEALQILPDRRHLVLLLPRVHRGDAFLHIAL